jgi:Fe-S oxidoreductase
LHHSQFILGLLEEGKIQLKDQDLKVTFHDPCYLGRYNSEYEAPRRSLKKIKGLQIVEMEKSKEKGMCCGAGGGHFWMDRKIGERVNYVRVDQAKQTGAPLIATACPFCMQMLEDGARQSVENPMEIKDIAEILLENMK